MKRTIVFLVVTLLAACGDDGGDKPILDFTQCRGSDESYVRNAELAILGRRPFSEGEVDVYAQLLRGVKEKDKNHDELHARRVVARALMQNPEYVARWERHFMDRLRVPRADDQDLRSCYGQGKRQPDGGALARAVVAAAPTAQVPGGDFNMRDLLRSSIEADDLTPAYRGHLFAMVTRAIPAANVSEEKAELARREDFGNNFDAVYLNRDIVCLGCHNSEFSTTDRDNPADDRFWPIPGLFEKSIYGASTGVEPRRAHAMFRFQDFVNGNDSPWGWSPDCGTFTRDVGDDTLTGIDAAFGKLRGKRSTVYDTEAALAHGFKVLREDGLALGADQTIADPDVAFAYLVAINIVDGVWSEVTGSSLVIANYFPRNEAARDVLHLLTEKFVASGFSLQALLEEILVGPYFDRLPPASGCGTGPYNMPAVYDPWVKSDSVEERRQNGPGDGVHALSSRTAAHAAYDALGWKAGPVQDFPTPGECDQADCDTLQAYCEQVSSCCTEYHDYCELGHRPDVGDYDDERAFEGGVGMFQTNAERGFRGMEFQARLEWENRFARCTAPTLMGGPQAADFIDGLVERAGATQGATLRDLVVALKDRLVSDPSVAEGGEQAALEAVLGAGLDTPAAGPDLPRLEERLRLVCGALLASPQFLLGGQSTQIATPVPKLTAPETGFDQVCTRVAGRPLPENLTVTCADGRLNVN